jgi:hypothetical protein
VGGDRWSSGFLEHHIASTRYFDMRGNGMERVMILDVEDGKVVGMSLLAVFMDEYER